MAKIGPDSRSNYLSPSSHSNGLSFCMVAQKPRAHYEGNNSAFMSANGYGGELLLAGGGPTFFVRKRNFMVHCTFTIQIRPSLGYWPCWIRNLEREI